MCSLHQQCLRCSHIECYGNIIIPGDVFEWRAVGRESTGQGAAHMVEKEETHFWWTDLIEVGTVEEMRCVGPAQESGDISGIVKETAVVVSLISDVAGYYSVPAVLVIIDYVLFNIGICESHQLDKRLPKRL